MKTIIITGAAGEVGLNLINLLNKKNYEIIAIDKNKTNLKLLKKLFPSVKCYCFDLAKNSYSWQKLFKNINVVIQLHAQISSPKLEPFIKNNIISIKNVVSVCEKYKIKNLIHASSSVVISVANDNYTKTKREGEKIVKKSIVPHTILRPTLMYGCFDIKHLGFLTTLFDISPIFPMPGSGKYIRQPLFVEDFAKIIINLIDKKPKNEIYNIVGKEKLFFIDLLRIIAKQKKKKILFATIPILLFNFMLRTYSFITGKTHYVPEQLAAMTAGDIFPVIDWEKIFLVKYTKYKEGVKKMLSSKYYSYYILMKKEE